jgi:drug/metabolite transporter (DMT)-like permease
MKVFFINGILMLVIGNGLVTWAEIYVSSGLAALICSLTPIWIVLLNTFSGHKENLTTKIILGLIICIAGQLLIFRDNLSDFANPNYLLGIIFILIANASWAYGSVYMKNHQTETHPLLGAGIQMLCGGIILDLFGTFRGEWTQMHPQQDAVIALIYLITVGSVVAYGAYMYVLKHMPATIVSTYAYVNTIVAVFLGWLWLDEKLNSITLIAVALTISGVYLINRTFQKA